MGMSRYLARAVINHVLKRTVYTAATNIYVALMTSSTGTEVSGGSYARVICNGWNAASDADPTISANTDVITFPTPTVSWGNVTHFQIFDASSGTTNALSDVEALTYSKLVSAGEAVTFPVGQLTWSLN